MRRMLAVLACALALACKKEQQAAAPPPEPAPGTPAWKIANARTAAPFDVASGATVLDWPASDTAQPPQLAAGTNGWSCFPDEPNTPANDPFCADEEMMKWVNAWAKHQPPRLTAMGVGYALQGGESASDTDPFKLAPDSGQQWLVNPPTVVIVMPNPRAAFAGLPTTRTASGPWVMYAGTPYAHLMVPAGRTP